MRNLLTYPVTKDEVIEYLTKRADEQSEDPHIGNTDGLVIMTLLRLVEHTSPDEIQRLGVLGPHG